MTSNYPTQVQNLGQCDTTKLKLQWLEVELLALVGVAAGLSASLRLSTCCRGFRAALDSTTADEELFGSLYAAFAGVQDAGQVSGNRTPSPRRARCPSTSSASRSPSAFDGAPLEAKRSRLPANHDAGRSCLEGHGIGIGGVKVSPRDLATQERWSTRPLLDRPGGMSSWKERLRQGFAAEKEPMDRYSFLADTRGKQDVRMVVVPSSPPVIAVTCTTELSLFSMDGTRLPPVVRREMYPSGDGSAGTGERGHEDPVLRHARFGRPEREPPKVIESHQRDIRSIAASSEGDMVATGSLDCTILVRSVPGDDWVVRLRGHDTAVGSLLFHRGRIVSADRNGYLMVWTVTPPRRIQSVRAHRDSIQHLIAAGCKDERLVSAGLDECVRVWSVTEDGLLLPEIVCPGFVHPYSVVAVRGIIAYWARGHASRSRYSVSTSDARGPRPQGEREAYLAEVVALDERTGLRTVYVPRERRPGRGETSPHLSTSASGSRSALASGSRSTLGSASASASASAPENDGFLLVDVLSGSGALRALGPDYRTQIVGSSACLGAFLLPRIDHVADWEEEGPREDGQSNVKGCLCRVDAGGTRVGQDSAAYARAFSTREGVGGRTTRDVRVSCWQELVSDRGAVSTPEKTAMGRSARKAATGGLPASDISWALEADDSAAWCTSITSVGFVVFLGYDTGGIWAHRYSDGRRLYRLDVHGPVMYLEEVAGCLFAYSGSGGVWRWSWAAQR